MTFVPSWATYDPDELGSSATPYAVQNFVDGKWTKAKTSMDIPHPMDKNSHPIFTVPDTQADEITPFLESLRKVSKSGKHNPLKNNDRYVKYGEIARLVSLFTLISADAVADADADAGVGVDDATFDPIFHSHAYL
jgi:1-pyrroline-5-carboxylate dehydrogenase